MLKTLSAVGLVANTEDASSLKKPTKDLSFGQQQRLSVARMMLDESDIVIIDEPLAGVDAFTFRELLPHFVKVIQHSGRTVVLFSHRLAFSAYVDQIVVLGDRGAVASGRRRRP